MKLTDTQDEAIKPFLPVQRGNVRIPNRRFPDALLFVLKTGIPWGELDEQRFGKWNTIYKRANRWAKPGVLENVFLELQKKGLICVGILSLDSRSIKVHQEATGALKKTAHKPLVSVAGGGIPTFIWSPQMLERLCV